VPSLHCHSARGPCAFPPHCHPERSAPAGARSRRISGMQSDRLGWSLRSATPATHRPFDSLGCASLAQGDGWRGRRALDEGALDGEGPPGPGWGRGRGREVTQSRGTAAARSWRGRRRRGRGTSSHPSHRRRPPAPAAGGGSRPPSRRRTRCASGVSGHGPCAHDPRRDCLHPTGSASHHRQLRTNHHLLRTWRWLFELPAARSAGTEAAARIA